MFTSLQIMKNKSQKKSQKRKRRNRLHNTVFERKNVNPPRTIVERIAINIKIPERCFRIYTQNTLFLFHGSFQYLFSNHCQLSNDMYYTIIY